MICETCREAGRLNQAGLIPYAYREHRKCEGDCCCQHKIGEGWVVRNPNTKA
jgi:hypothetical protein